MNNCIFFKPNTSENCEIASANFEVCKIAEEYSRRFELISDNKI